MDPVLKAPRAVGARMTSSLGVLAVVVATTGFGALVYAALFPHQFIDVFLTAIAIAFVPAVAIGLILSTTVRWYERRAQLSRLRWALIVVALTAGFGVIATVLGTIAAQSHLVFATLVLLIPILCCGTAVALFGPWLSRRPTASMIIVASCAALAVAGVVNLIARH